MNKLESLIIEAVETYILEELADGEWYDDNHEEIVNKYWEQAITELKEVVKNY